MKLLALDIPDEPAEQPAWLERHLVGLDLAALVAELEAIHGPSPTAGPTVTDLLGERLEAVLASGLSALPARSFNQLLRRPRLLPDLQELVLTRGGDHWSRIPPLTDDRAALAARGRKRLAAWLARPKPKPRPRNSRPWLVPLAAAAVLLVAVVALELARQPVSTAWGWDRPGALPVDLPRAAYLTRLADDAEEWFAQSPDNPLALAHRLAEFRRACSTLLLVDHPSLAPQDRAWLRRRCREWAAKLDALLAEIEAPGDLGKVRAEADETVRKLIAALRDRAIRPV